MNKKEHNILRAFAMISQIGIAMMVPLFLCAAIGLWLDSHFQTQYWFLIMLLPGLGAAFRSFFVLTRSFYAADMKKEHEQLEYFQSLKDYSREHPGEQTVPQEEGRYKQYPDPKNSSEEERCRRDERENTR